MAAQFLFLGIFVSNFRYCVFDEKLVARMEEIKRNIGKGRGRYEDKYRQGRGKRKGEIQRMEQKEKKGNSDK